MSTLWIKWTKQLQNKREVALVASRLKRDKHEIAGRLMAMWEWCDDNISDDCIDDDETACITLGDGALEFLDSITGLPGLAKSLTDPDVNWLQLDDVGQVKFIHHGRHNGTSAKSRALEARKKQKQRSKSKKTNPDSVPRRTGQKRDQKREDKIRNKNPPPSPSGESWSAVEEELSKLGIADISGCIDPPQKRGVPPGEILRLITFAAEQPDRWGNGAIHRRIQNHTPGLPVDQSWPEDSTEFKKHKLRKNQNEQWEKQQEKKLREQEERKHRQQRKAELEKRHGEKIDSLSPDEIRAILGGHEGAKFLLAEFHNRGSKSRTIRDTLLNHFEQLQEKADDTPDDSATETSAA